MIKIISINNLLISVVLDDSGFSKGFGFIRFNNEQEQQTALTSMMGVSGLGGKPLKVSLELYQTLSSSSPCLSAKISKVTSSYLLRAQSLIYLGSDPKATIYQRWG